MPSRYYVERQTAASCEVVSRLTGVLWSHLTEHLAGTQWSLQHDGSPLSRHLTISVSCVLSDNSHFAGANNSILSRRNSQQRPFTIPVLLLCLQPRRWEFTHPDHLRDRRYPTGVDGLGMKSPAAECFMRESRANCSTLLNALSYSITGWAKKSKPT